MSEDPLRIVRGFVDRCALHDVRRKYKSFGRGSLNVVRKFLARQWLLMVLGTLLVLAGYFFYAISNDVQNRSLVREGDAPMKEGVAISLNMPGLYSSTTEDQMIGMLSAMRTAPIENERENENPKITAFEEDIRRMVQGYPIEEMVPFVAQQERKVAALIVGIAKKESDWGKHSPSEGGKDCYNYWGYKGNGSSGQAMGYACFSDPEEAISVVGKRIHELAIDKRRETPAKMIVWKCGSSCEGHDPKAVQKWISDVDAYYSKLVVIAAPDQHAS